MMQMFANRVNSRWVEQQEWDVPQVYDVSRFAASAGAKVVAE